jgi:hypothetical protein
MFFINGFLIIPGTHMLPEIAGLLEERLLGL